MKNILFAFMLFCLSASVSAQEKSVLSVLMNDGTNVCFYLSEQPVVTFVEDAVKIVSDTEEALIERALVNRFEFLAEMPTGIEDVEELEEKSARESFELAGNVISISGLSAGCVVKLYSINGQVLLSAVAGEDGKATLLLDSFSQGIYIVNYNETTIKFIKR